jgi:hypothetical protein
VKYLLRSIYGVKKDEAILEKAMEANRISRQRGSQIFYRIVAHMAIMFLN